MSGDFRKYPEIEQACADFGIQPRLTYRAPVLPSLDLCSLISPIAWCCAARRVSLSMAKGASKADDEQAPQDRSDFTREAFGSCI